MFSQASVSHSIKGGLGLVTHPLPDGYFIVKCYAGLFI